MKSIPYLLSGVLIAPGVLLAYFLWTVTHAVRQETLWRALFYLLVQAVRMMEWGVWVIAAAVLLWLTLAFVPKYRWLGAIAMAVVAVVALVEMLTATGAPKSAEDLSVPLLSLTGFLINVWLVWDGAPVPAPGK
jgi:hypothetical protein